jgi:hypothetical protein
MVPGYLTAAMGYLSEIIGEFLFFFDDEEAICVVFVRAQYCRT